MKRDYKDLTVWQKAIDLVTEVYKATRGFPKEELYGLTSQLRRCAVSVPSNIAEGQGRDSQGEFKRFLNIARGSDSELQTQLEIARALGFGESKMIDEAESLSHETGKMLFALLESL